MNDQFFIEQAFTKIQDVETETLERRRADKIPEWVGIGGLVQHNRSDSVMGETKLTHTHKFPVIDGFNPKTVYCKCGVPLVCIPPIKKSDIDDETPQMQMEFETE